MSTSYITMRPGDIRVRPLPREFWRDVLIAIDQHSKTLMHDHDAEAIYNLTQSRRAIEDALARS